MTLLLMLSVWLTLSTTIVFLLLFLPCPLCKLSLCFQMLYLLFFALMVPKLSHFNGYSLFKYCRANLASSLLLSFSLVSFSFLCFSYDVPEGGLSTFPLTFSSTNFSNDFFSKVGAIFVLLSFFAGF